MAVVVPSGAIALLAVTVGAPSTNQVAARFLLRNAKFTSPLRRIGLFAVVAWLAWMPGTWRTLMLSNIAVPVTPAANIPQLIVVEVAFAVHVIEIMVGVVLVVAAFIPFAIDMNASEVVVPLRA